MMHKLVGFVLGIMYTVVSVAQKDTLFFINKSVLIGELKTIKLGRVEFDGDGVGIVKVKYDKIQTLYAFTNRFRVETTNRKLLFGKILPSTQNGTIVLLNGGAKNDLALNQISSLSGIGENLNQRLSGVIGAGYTYTRSSKIGRITVNGKLNYRAKDVDLSLNGDMIFTTDSIRTYRERENLQFTSYYYFNQTWFAGVLLNYQRNIQLGLNRRLQSGIAGGAKLIQKQHSRLSAIAGSVINNELSTSNLENVFTELTTQITYDFFSFSKPNISLHASQKFYYSLSQAGRVRSDGDLKLNWELFNDFTLSFNFFYNYDRISPATGLPRNDFGFITGINYSF